MDNTSPLLALIAVITAVGTLFGWLLKQVVKFFIDKNNEKDLYIKELVRMNQVNVDEFKQTINHNQTKMNASIDKLTINISAQTEVFTQLVKAHYDRQIPK